MSSLGLLSRLGRAVYGLCVIIFHVQANLCVINDLQETMSYKIHYVN